MPELPARIERIVLIGLMGAGKSTIGKQLAAQLGWAFADLDQRIEVEAGRSVPDFFAHLGESAFRRLEQQLTTELLSKAGQVLAPGGGWAVHRKEPIPAETAVFWLEVSPEEAVRRLAHAPFRPLLAGDPLERARSLALERNEVYARLGVPVQTTARTPDQVVNDILLIAGERLNRRAPFPMLEHGKA